ncbi:MAG: hypothetical protein KatS3mg010_1999 [Acidimicrobiia bacterium]|nr:MAG: hypothetical protein KatS3mg010_1999 [Acidimicrobiia bacterium]
MTPRGSIGRVRTRLACTALATIVATGASACSSDDEDGGAAAELQRTEGSIAVEPADASTCDPLDTAACALPFPSDFFTVEDDDTDTGRRVAFGAESLPANASGVRIDPAEWNRSDGFSPGSLVMTVVPGLDAEGSKLPPVTDIGRSLDDASPIVLLDADDNERVPFWAEIDSRTAGTDTPILIVTPARALREGHRHVVAFRDLVDTEGRAIDAGDVFRAYRDRLDTGDDALEARRAAMEAVFSDLEAAGVERDGLYLAWDFTVASGRSLSARLLHMRDDAFAALGDGAPAFGVTETSEQGIVRVVRGTFDVPRYLTGDGSPGQTLDNDGDPDGIPTANGTHAANFVCTVPTAATAASPRARVALRPRPPRERERGGRHRNRGRDRERVVLRDRLDRHVDRGRAERGRGARRPRAVPQLGRPDAPGSPRLPVPRAARAPRGRLRDAPGVPGRFGRRGARPLRSVLPGREPGRDPRRRDERGGDRLEPRGCSPSPR